MFITPVIEEPAVQESALTPVVILDTHTCSGVADVLAHPFFLTHPRHQLEGFVVVRVALAERQAAATREAPRSSPLPPPRSFRR